MSKNILMNDVRIDTQTAYFVNGNIDIHPACYEHPEPLTAKRHKSYPARITVLDTGEAQIRPVNIGAHGPRYKVLYRTEHCDLQLWTTGKMVECWKFPPQLSIHEICRIRKRETPMVTAYLQTLK